MHCQSRRWIVINPRRIPSPGVSEIAWLSGFEQQFIMGSDEELGEDIMGSDE